MRLGLLPIAVFASIDLNGQIGYGIIAFLIVFVHANFQNDLMFGQLILFDCFLDREDYMVH